MFSLLPVDKIEAFGLDLAVNEAADDTCEKLLSLLVARGFTVYESGINICIDKRD